LQLRDLLHSAHVPYPHGLVARACKEEGGDGQQLQNKIRNACVTYFMTFRKQTRHVISQSSRHRNHMHTHSQLRAAFHEQRKHTHVQTRSHHPPRNTFIILMSLHAALLGQAQTDINKDSTTAAHQSNATITITHTMNISISLPSTSTSSSSSPSQ